MQCGSHHSHTRWVCDSQKSVVCAIGIVMAGTGFRSRSTNMKPQKAGFPKLRRCHGSTSPSLANIHIISQCHQVVSVFGFSLGFSRLFLFFLSSLASGFRFLISVFHSISFVFSFYEFIFELFLPFFLLVVLSQLLACSSGQFHDSILLVLFVDWGTWALSLPLAADFLLWAGVRMHIC